MRANGILCSGLFFLGVAAQAGPAAALTAGDVLDKMSNQEQTAYTFGSMEMAAFIAHAGGDAERARCIIDWYSNKDGLKKIFQGFDAFRDKQAAPIMYTLFNRACGE